MLCYTARPTITLFIYSRPRSCVHLMIYILLVYDSGAHTLSLVCAPRYVPMLAILLTLLKYTLSLVCAPSLLVRSNSLRYRDLAAVTMASISAR